MARRNIGGLVGSQQYLCFPIDNLGGSPNHDPMLAAMMMHLQGEGGTRFYLNPLNLEALAHFEHSIGAPRTMHGHMMLMQFSPACLETLYDLLHILTAILMGNKERIRCVDNQQILHADSRSQTVWATDIGVTGTFQLCLADYPVALPIGTNQLRHGLPRADIAPTDITRYHRYPSRLFHKCIVDGIILHFPKSFG